MKIMSQKMWHYFIFQIVSILLFINFVNGSGGSASKYQVGEGSGYRQNSEKNDLKGPFRENKGLKDLPHLTKSTKIHQIIDVKNVILGIFF
jgi:hypothetical protein